MPMQKEIQLPPLPLGNRTSSDYPLNTGRDGMGTLQQATAGPGCPGVFRGLKGSCISGFLSTWPAHVTSQIVQQGRWQTASGEIRNHGCGDEFSGPVGKPRFLKQLEGYLKRELKALDPRQPKVQERRLQAYREVFDCFIEDFKTYKPLLSAIKNEYEITLAYLRDQIRELEPLRAQLVLVSEQCEKRILGLREKERAEIRDLKQECQRLQSVIENMREKQSALQTQVCHLQEDLAAQYLQYREESDARKLLIVNISSMRYGPEEEPDEEQEDKESEDPVKVKLALKVCREDLTVAQVELNRLQAEYGDVVPRRDWENLDRTHRESQLTLETLQTDFDQMKTEYDTLLDMDRQVAMQRDSLQGELDGFREASTPRPHWEKCADLLGDCEHWTKLFEGQSSQRRLEILLGGVQGKATEQKELFTGLGTAGEVPVYLCYEGQLKNLKLNKADVVRVIKEVWKEKISEDEQKDDSGGLPEFLHRYLEGHHGEQAGEWAYSLMEGIQQHLKDDFISLFNDILTEKVDESVYHRQVHLLSHLLKVLIHSDTTESGTLTVPEFSEALKKAFPLKAEQDIEELVTAAQTELENSGGTIAYQRLYSEDVDGKHRNFLSLVTRQITTERHLYINQLRTQLGGRGEVTVADLSTAFKTVDPSLDSETLEWNLSMAFHLPDEELHLHTEHLDTEIALQRLSVADVGRAGPAPHLD